MIGELYIVPKDPVDFRILTKLQNLLKRSRHQDVVAIEEPDPGAARCLNAIIAGRTAAAVFLMNDAETGV